MYEGISSKFLSTCLTQRDGGFSLKKSALRTKLSKERKKQKYLQLFTDFHVHSPVNRSISRVITNYL